MAWAADCFVRATAMFPAIKLTGIVRQGPRVIGLLIHSSLGQGIEVDDDEKIALKGPAGRRLIVIAIGPSHDF